MTAQLQALVRRFPSKYVHSNPSGGGSYVGHEVVVQRLLHALGGYDFELVEILYDDLPELVANPAAKGKREQQGARALPHCLVGAVCRLTLVVDGERRVLEEVGDCEDPRNWPHNGARMKDAMSDAIKRCAMRAGVAIHLWAQDEFYIDEALKSASQVPVPMAGKPEPSGAPLDGDAAGPTTSGPAAEPSLLAEVPA